MKVRLLKKEVLCVIHVVSTDREKKNWYSKLWGCCCMKSQTAEEVLCVIHAVNALSLVLIGQRTPTIGWGAKTYDHFEENY